MDPQLLCREDELGFQLAVRAGVERPGKAGRQYLANLFGPKRETGAHIPLIYFAIQGTDPKTLKEKGAVDEILAAARGVSGQLGIDPSPQTIFNNSIDMRRNPRRRTRLMLAMSLALCNKFRVEHED